MFLIRYSSIACEFKGEGEGRCTEKRKRSFKGKRKGEKMKRRGKGVEGREVTCWEREEEEKGKEAGAIKINIHLNI